MKNALKTALVAVAALGLTLSACKKDDKSAAEILQTGSWKVSKQESKLTAEATWTEEAIDACSADDFTTFTSATAYTFDEGATKCDPADDQTTTGVWSVSSDGKTLTIDGLAAAAEVSESKVVLTITNFLGLGQDSRVTMVPK